MLGSKLAPLSLRGKCGSQSLGAATPTAVIVGMGRGAEAGILVRDAALLESAGRMRAVLWDKTGTLTEGKPRLVTVEVAPGEDEATVLALAAALRLEPDAVFLLTDGALANDATAARFTRATAAV